MNINEFYPVRVRQRRRRRTVPLARTTTAAVASGRANGI